MSMTDQNAAAPPTTGAQMMQPPAPAGPGAPAPAAPHDPAKDGPPILPGDPAPRIGNKQAGMAVVGLSTLIKYRYEAAGLMPKTAVFSQKQQIAKALMATGIGGGAAQGGEAGAAPPSGVTPPAAATPSASAPAPQQ